MRAYMVLAEKHLNLDDIVKVQREYKSHRCAVDGADGILKVQAKITQTEAQLRITKRTQVRREHDAIRSKAVEKHKKDMRSYFKRVERKNKQNK